MVDLCDLDLHLPRTPYSVVADIPGLENPSRRQTKTSTLHFILMFYWRELERSSKKEPSEQQVTSPANHSHSRRCSGCPVGVEDERQRIIILCVKPLPGSRASKGQNRSSYAAGIGAPNMMGRSEGCHSGQDTNIRRAMHPHILDTYIETLKRVTHIAHPEDPANYRA